ncbi:protein prenyltransferase alpha subunit repeat-containing protein 1-like isoform X2 [Watersipora subatra]|uniref:protein prenyltransferase alpha subunit repeat-containing protein 1-like isoform X2 n=1 Tax=Watersipora subatra TaxID=2589382 RepID=UPI00355B0880
MERGVLQGFVDYVYGLVTAQRVSEVHVVAACSEAWTANPKEYICIQENHLGVPVNVLKSAYQLAYDKAKAKSSAGFQGLAQCTFILLLVNPHLTVFWNKRKQMCVHNQGHAEENIVSAVLLLTHPKCLAIFEHRRWLLQQTGFMSEEKLVEELDLCTITADRYSNNYYSWSHRQWCLLLISQPKVYRKDLVRVRNWRERNVSQYSAFNHCQFLLSELSDGSRELMYEYQDIVSLINHYPGHESLWYYRSHRVGSL